MPRSDDQAIANEAAAYLRQRELLRVRQIPVYVRTAYPWPFNFNFPLHAYRETYFLGLLPEGEFLIGRKGADQERMNNNEWLRMAIRAVLRPAERPQLGVVI